MYTTPRGIPYWEISASRTTELNAHYVGDARIEPGELHILPCRKTGIAAGIVYEFEIRSSLKKTPATMCTIRNRLTSGHKRRRDDPVEFRVH